MRPTLRSDEFRSSSADLDDAGKARLRALSVELA